MAQIALNVIIFAVVMGLTYTVRTAILSRQRKTRWRIHLVKREGGYGDYECITHSLILWDTTLPPEIAVHHLPMVGSKWADAIVDHVGSEPLP